MYWSRWFRRIIEDLEREFERFEMELDRMFSSVGSGRGEAIGPYVYGFSVTIGPEGVPVVRTFGNVPRAEEGYRTPFVDVILDEKANQVRVIAELPGVSKEDIDINATERSVEIRAERGDRKYRAVVDLPVEVDVNSAKASYNNGVLEITFKPRREVRPKGTKIKVE
ncbi:MAG TPA: Hsp20/alpha crystallin family protein [Candidatus Korarchaeota archaeon]|nr:Hsp20/alpha crystallin family protein [Candidatus Korarchaeota archaeon]